MPGFDLILASCLRPKDMAEDFGTVGVLPAPLAAAGGLAAGLRDADFVERCMRL